MTEFSFKAYRFNAHTNRLFRSGEETAIQPKTAELLGVFLQHQGEVLTKEFLLEALWPDTTVTDHVLFQSLKKLRAILREEDHAVWIKTYPKQGYQWVYPVTEELDPPTPSEKTKALRTPTAYLGMVVLTLAFVAWWFLPLTDSEIASPEPGSSRLSVAVADFTNLSPVVDHQWYGLAIAEIIRTDMASTESLRLLPGESTVQAFSDLGIPTNDSLSSSTLNKLRRYLGNDYLVSGSYLIEDEQVRLNLTVQETGAAEIVFSYQKTAPKQALIETLSEASNALRTHLNINATSGAEDNHLADLFPANPEATKAYVLGLSLIRHYRYQEAIQQLEHALSLKRDPMVLSSLANAWAHLGYAEKARQLSQQALNHSDSLSRQNQLSVQAQYHRSHSEWRQAAQLYQSLWSFFPDDWDTAQELIACYLADGEADRANEVLDQWQAQLGDLEDARVPLLRARSAQLVADPVAQIEWSRQAIQWAKTIGNQAALAEGHLMLSEGLRKTGETQQAFNSAEAALLTFDRLKHTAGYAAALQEKGNLYLQTGALETARGFFNQTLAFCAENGQLQVSGKALNNLGAIEFRSGRYDQALDYFGQAQSAFEQVDDKKRRANTLVNTGIIYKMRGELDAALDQYREADFLYRNLKDANGLYHVTHALATLEHQRGRPQEARDLFRQALELIEDHGLTAQKTQALTNLAQIKRQLGEIGAAIELLNQAIALAAQQQKDHKLATALFRKAELLFYSGHLDDAYEAMNRSREAFERTGQDDAKICDLWLLRIRAERASEPTDRSSLAQIFPPDSQWRCDYLLLETEIRLLEGRKTDALTTVESADGPCDKTSWNQRRVVVAELQARSYLVNSRIPQAQGALSRASKLADEWGFQFEKWQIDHTRARLLWVQGLHLEAIDLIDSTREQFERRLCIQKAGDCALTQATFLYEKGQFDASRSLINSHLEIWRERGLKRLELQAQSLLQRMDHI